MPVYEYKCTECTDRFEIEQRISDDALTTLEGCAVAADGSHRLKKVFSSIGISFKGDGFYRNDARGGKSARRSSESSSDSSSSSSTADAGSSSANGGSSDKSSSATPAATPTPAPSTTSSKSSSTD